MRLCFDHRESGQVWVTLLVEVWGTEAPILDDVDLPIKGYSRTVADVTEMQGILRRIYDAFHS